VESIAEKIIEIIDPEKSAEVADLCYVSDLSPGIKREKSGKRFIYIDIDGNKITDRKELKRIKSLIIPPAWKDVWICNDPNGHLQATGRDSKGRKQYRYHFRWQEIRNELKFDKMLAFGQVLPKIRQKTREDLALPGLPREKVLALVISIMEESLVRIGNPEYARENSTFGLTTMKNNHVKVENFNIKFKFRGKSGKYHEIKLRNPKLAKLIKRCQDLPGYDLFEYLDDEGNPHSISSTDINKYICDITNQNFTAKDYRTWGGSVYAMKVLQDFSEFDNETEAKKNITMAIKLIAKKLGNTTAVCKKYYIHPAVTEAYLNKTLNSVIENNKYSQSEDLHPEEIALIKLIEQKIQL
jgi:DNA topoisomerase-1